MLAYQGKNRSRVSTTSQKAGVLAALSRLMYGRWLPSSSGTRTSRPTTRWRTSSIASPSPARGVRGRVVSASMSTSNEHREWVRFTVRLTSAERRTGVTLTGTGTWGNSADYTVAEAGAGDHDAAHIWQDIRRRPAWQARQG